MPGTHLPGARTLVAVVQSSIAFHKKSHRWSARSHAFVSSEWQFEEHLQLLAKTIMGPDCLKKFGWLVDMILESEKERDEFAKNAFDYALECLSNRCRTLSKYGAPPMSWANGLSHAPNIQLESRKCLKSDWNRLFACGDVGGANGQLYCSAEDLQLLFGAPERLLCQCLEAADFDFRRAPKIFGIIGLSWWVGLQTPKSLKTSIQLCAQQLVQRETIA